MSVLITGANGYIGSHLDFSAFQESVLKLDQQGAADFEGCISEVTPDWLIENDVHFVVHLADLRLQFYNQENFEVEQAKQKDFFSALKGSGRIKSLLYASSCSVYGESDVEISEDSEVRPTTQYAQAKLGTELMIRESGIPYTILRFGTAYGGSKNIREDLFVNLLIKQAVANEKMDIFGVEAWRPYVNAVDFSRALSYFYQSPLNKTVNVSETNQRKIDVINRLSEMSLGRNKLLVDETRKDPRNYFVSSAKAKGLGFTFAVDFDSGISGLIDYYQSNR